VPNPAEQRWPRDLFFVLRQSLVVLLHWQAADQTHRDGS
jgi:hypothetical protein